jgi:radical SAM protein with 4Fe4S-binding SPASM domain
MKTYTFFDQIQNHKEYAAREVELISSPTIENIELISLCNLECKMCVVPPERSQRMISLEQVIDITEKNIDLLKGEYVWLHHFGEPLMHPQLIDIINYLSEAGINPRLSTNGTLLTYETSKNLILSGLKEIVFSLDGVNKESYEQLRKGGNFNQVRENIRDFLEIKDSLNSQEPITQIQFVNIYNSKEEAQQFIDYWSETSVNWINIKTPSTRAHQVVDEKIKKSILKAYPKEDPLKKDFPCYWLWSSLVILSDGNVVPCCTDLSGINVLGNVFEDTLSDIWSGARAKSLRQDQISGEYNLSPICQQCPEIKGYSCSFEEKKNEESMIAHYKKRQLKHGHHLLIKNG